MSDPVSTSPSKKPSTTCAARAWCWPGAGSGKTRVITHKIARLIQTGVEPAHCRHHLHQQGRRRDARARARPGGQGRREVLICTFHALGVRLLREDGAALGLKPKFSILDSDDVLGLIKDCGATTDAATARQWQWAISRWKNAGLTPPPRWRRRRAKASARPRS
jgi:ATP-dependent DNA helicase Rep